MTHSLRTCATHTCLEVSRFSRRKHSYRLVVCLIHTCDLTHSFTMHVCDMTPSFFIRMCGMTHSYHAYVLRCAEGVTQRRLVSAYCIHLLSQCLAFLRATCVWHDSFISVTWLIHMCDMPHSYAWFDLFVCVTLLIRMCDMTHSYVQHNAFIRATWRIHMCDMTHSYVWHDSFICAT